MIVKEATTPENTTVERENDKMTLIDLIESLDKLERKDLVGINMNTDSQLNKKLSSLDMIKINYENNGIIMNKSWIEDDCLKYSKHYVLNQIETKFFKGYFILFLSVIIIIS